MPRPSILRKRHEAEEITPVSGPLECDVSGIETLKHLHEYEKAHKFDPNFPIDELNDLDAAIATGNAEKGIEIEHALMEDNSPYPEVYIPYSLVPSTSSRYYPTISISKHTAHACERPN